LNKRQNKKKIKYILNNIQTINLKENEFLLFRFDTNKWKPKDLADFSQQISENITSKIIFIPSDLEMKKVIEQTK